MALFGTLGEGMNFKPETQWLLWVISLRPTGLAKSKLIDRETVRFREVESFSPDPRAVAGAQVQRQHISRYHSPSLCLYSFPVALIIPISKGERETLTL